MVACHGRALTGAGPEHAREGDVCAFEAYLEFVIEDPEQYKDFVDEYTGSLTGGEFYYDPVIGRFINADGYVSTGQDFLGYNMYAYCGNNPVCYSDSTGCLEVWQLLGFEYDGSASDFKRLEAGLPPNDYVEWLRGSEERNRNITRFVVEDTQMVITGISNIPADQVAGEYQRMVSDYIEPGIDGVTTYVTFNAIGIFVSNPYINVGANIYEVISMTNDYELKTRMTGLKNAMDNDQSLLIVKWELQGDYFSHIKGVSYYSWNEKELPFAIGNTLDF